MPYGDCTGPDGLGPMWMRGYTPMTSMYVPGFYAGFSRFLPYFVLGSFLTRGLGRFWRGFLGWGRGCGQGRGMGMFGGRGYGRGRGRGIGMFGGWGYGRGRGRGYGRWGRW